MNGLPLCVAQYGVKYHVDEWCEFVKHQGFHLKYGVINGVSESKLASLYVYGSNAGDKVVGDRSDNG